MNKTTSQWAFDYLRNRTERMADWLYLTSSSWFVLPMIARIQDSSSIFSIKPLSIKPSTMSIGSNKPVKKGQHRSKKTRCDAMEIRTKSDVVEYRNVPQMNRRVSSVSASSQPELMDEPIYPSVSHSLPRLYEKNKLMASPEPVQSSSIILPQPALRRVDSKEWIKDYKNKKERIDKINFNNIFGGRGDAENNEIPSLPPLNSTHEHTGSPSASPRYVPEVHHSMPPSPSSASTSTASTLHSVTELTSQDVICGRGGKANSHEGNISFRAEALKLRSWYESSSKSEKFTISNLLVDFVKERGGRFLKRDSEHPGRWLECDGNDVRKKASQALREGKLKDLSKG